MKRYKIKKSQRLIDRLKPFYDRYRMAEDRFYVELRIIEKQMAKEVHIKDIEFIFVDGEMAGIGNADRTMELIHRGDLER